MMPIVVKLRKEEFTEDRVMPILRAIGEEMAEKGHGLHSLASLRGDFCDAFAVIMGLGIGHAWMWKDRGIFLALKSHDLFSQMPRAALLLAGVLPLYRGTNIARELFEAFEAWARDEGCADVSGASHAFHPRDDSWENHGYKKTETIFSKEL